MAAQHRELPRRRAAPPRVDPDPGGPGDRPELLELAHAVDERERGTHPHSPGA